MKQTRAIALVSGILVFSSGQAANTAAGLATRDLNPVLQQFYLPSYTPYRSDDGWRIDHSFYVTNTSQKESSGNENLIIDVENYRYQLGLRYRKDNWLSQVDVPYMANSGGELDSTIENWHDFFGLPNGDRDDFQRNQVDVGYSRDGAVEYSQDKSSNGLADISLALGYQLSAATRFSSASNYPPVRSPISAAMKPSIMRSGLLTKIKLIPN